MLRRFVLVVCAAVVCAGTLVGCNNDGGANSTGTTGSAVKSKKPLAPHTSGEKHTPAAKPKKKAADDKKPSTTAPADTKPAAKS